LAWRNGVSVTQVCFEDVEAAGRRIGGVAVQTPLLENDDINSLLKRRVLFKPECLQVTGSFKFRGAYNRLAQLSDAERAAGVVAWSSGNHAQGVAAAAAKLSIPAIIVMPSDAPRVKMENTKALGATVLPYDRKTESREEIATALSVERGMVLVPSFDDPHIIAGQGTAGIEIAAQAKEAGVTLDDLIVCCGGGGLVGGISIAMKALSPQTRVFSSEPMSFNDTARSLAAGERLGNAPDAESICDALLAPMPGKMTFPINLANLSGGFAVSEEAVKEAMRLAYKTLKLVVEPGGAVALAALIEHEKTIAGDTVGIVLSGGNVDPALYAEIIGGK
jgi:threonine dehydratase